jgi:hypothetical protein
MPNGFIHTALRPPVYFYHVPKTGGMSLRSFLADQYLDEDLCSAQDWQSLAALDRASLQSFRLFYGHFAVNLKQFFRVTCAPSPTCAAPLAAPCRPSGI